MCNDVDGAGAEVAILRISRRGITSPDTFWDMLGPAVDSGGFNWKGVSGSIGRWSGGDTGVDSTRGGGFVHHRLWSLTASRNAHTAKDLMAIPPTIHYHPRPSMDSLHEEETRAFPLHG